MAVFSSFIFLCSCELLVLVSTMLVSTRVVLQYSARKVVVRDWRIVVIPEEDIATASVLSLFEAIVHHTYDALEPLILSPDQRDCPVQAQVNRTAPGSFQDIPMTARLVELVEAFGMYIKFVLQLESATTPSAATCSTTQAGKNAMEVSLHS